MNIWIMNLKDNRDAKDNGTNITKFDFCKANSIVGIGWVGYDESSNDAGYLLANKYIDEFEIGDLVWTKSDYDEYYLCKIESKAVKTDDEKYNNNDISKFCKCKYIPIDSFPDGIEKQELVARRTIERANESISDITESYFNLLYENADKKTSDSDSKKRFFSIKNTIMLSVCVALAAIIVLCIIVGVNSSQEISDATSVKTVVTDTVSQEDKNNSESNDDTATFPDAIEGGKLIVWYLESKGVKFNYRDGIPVEVDYGNIVWGEDNSWFGIELGGNRKYAQIVYSTLSNTEKWFWSIYLESDYYDFDVFEALEELTQNCSITSKPPITYLKQRLKEAGSEAFDFDHAIVVKYMGIEYKMCNDYKGNKPVMITIKPVN